jgi:hypothetical protein
MKARYVLPALYLGALAGVGIWAATDPKGFMRKSRKARRKIEKTTGARLPRPDIMLVGPEDSDAFDDLDARVCEFSFAVHSEQPQLLDSDPEAFVDAVAGRTLADLFPDFPWPAVSGDHPSAAEIQGLVRYEVRRSLLDETLCLTEPDLEELASTEEAEEDTFIPPPAEGN